MGDPALGAGGEHDAGTAAGASVGVRDEAALALSGMLVAGGWNYAAADACTMAVARVAGDEEWQTRGKGAATARRRAAGEPAWGRTALAKRLRGEGARVAQQVAEWLELGNSSSRPDALDNTGTRGEWGEWGESRSVALTLPVSPIINLTAVPEVDLRWLWPGRLPLGKITMLDGDPGLGKSLLTLDLVARVVRGEPMPDGAPGVAGGAVILSVEDGLGDTVRPRLRAAGVATADELRRIQTLGAIDEVNPTTGSSYQRALALPRDLPWLAEAAREVDARLVVIDPLMAYLSGKVNSWRDQDVRVALAPLARLAEELDLAVLILRHLNKAVGANAIYRGGGSIGLIGAARAGWQVAKDPEDPEHQRVLANTKSNLGPPMPALRYRIETENGHPPRVTWLGECSYSADTLLAAGSVAPVMPARGRMGRAMEWLTKAPAGGPRPKAEVVAAAATAGFTERNMEDARARLRVRWHREGFGVGGVIYWEAPDVA